MIAWIATALAAQVTPYPLPVGDTASSVYTVSVNGTNVPVSNSRDASYAHFAFSGTARVVVTVSQAVESYRLSPASTDLAGGGVSIHRLLLCPGIDDFAGAASGSQAGRLRPVLPRAGRVL